MFNCYKTYMTYKIDRIYKIIIGITVVLMSVAIVAGLNSLRANQRDEQRAADLVRLGQMLELYYAKLERYPDSLSELATSGLGIAAIPQDPLSPKREYMYQTQENGQLYTLTAQFEQN